MDPPKNDSDKLDQLKDRIRLASDSGTEKSFTRENHKNINYAWRMVLELVVGMLIGVLVGYTFDYLLGSAPWMLIIMSLFGFGAGVRVMMKTAEEFTQSGKNRD